MKIFSLEGAIVFEVVVKKIVVVVDLNLISKKMAY